MKPYTQHKYKNFADAQVKQKQMKQRYGYKPSIFQVTTKTGKQWFAVVQPHGLEPVPKIAEEHTKLVKKFHKVSKGTYP